MEWDQILKQKYYLSEKEKLHWFGDGEWIKEPDFFEFTYRHFDCKIFRTCIKEPYSEKFHIFGGHLCGYVLVPEDHPYFEMKYQDMGINCHQGLTFSEMDSQKRYWIGFDCGHYVDYIPSLEKFKTENKILKEPYPLPEGFEKFSIFNPVYRNIEYCIGECISIVDQLIEAK